MDSSQKLTQCGRISPYRTSDNFVEFVRYLIHRFSALSRYIQLGKLALFRLAHLVIRRRLPVYAALP